LAHPVGLGLGFAFLGQKYLHSAADLSEVHPVLVLNLKLSYCSLQRRSQEFDLGGYKWVKETKQPHKIIKVD